MNITMAWSFKVKQKNKMPQIQIRTTVTPADAAFIIGAFDSTLPHLESIGSGSQWGSIPFSQRGPEGGLIGIVDGMIEKAIEYRKTGNKDHVVVFIAEIGPLSQERTVSAIWSTREFE